VDGIGQYLDSDGNRVNFGNFDGEGLNVNNYWDDNRNDNIGLSAARQSSSIQGNSRHAREFLLSVFGRFDPASKHPSYFVEICLDDHVFLRIDCLNVFHKADADA
jgi:hypothetical protein